MSVTFPAVDSEGDSTHIQPPLLADRCTINSSGIAGGKPEVLLLSAVKRAGLFYRSKLRTLFVSVIKILHVL